MSENAVTKAEIVEFLAESHQLSKAKAARILGSLEDYIAVGLKQGKDVRLSIGIFQSKSSPARTSRNPVTGEPVSVPEKKRVRFRAAAPLKRAVNEDA